MRHTARDYRRHREAMNVRPPLLMLAALLIVVPPATRILATCAGDCDGDGQGSSASWSRRWRSRSAPCRLAAARRPFEGEGGGENMPDAVASPGGAMFALSVTP